MSGSRAILLVDDDAAVIGALGTAIRSLGHRVHAARDAAAARRVLASAPVDAVLSDLRMPHEDGLSLLRAAADSQPGLPLVLMTAWPSATATERLRALGGFDLLPKPLDLIAIEALFARLDACGWRVRPSASSRPAVPDRQAQRATTEIDVAAVVVSAGATPSAAPSASTSSRTSAIRSRRSQRRRRQVRATTPVAVGVLLGALIGLGVMLLLAW